MQCGQPGLLSSVHLAALLKAGPEAHMRSNGPG